MNRRHLYLRSLVLALMPLALTLGACAPSTANTSLPLRYLAPSDALFDTLVREAPRRHVVVNPYEGRFELIAANREAGVVSLAYDLRDLYGPARQTATFQLFDNQDGTVSVVTAAATTSRLGYPADGRRTRPADVHAARPGVSTVALTPARHSLSRPEEKPSRSVEPRGLAEL